MPESRRPVILDARPRWPASDDEHNTDLEDTEERRAFLATGPAPRTTARFVRCERSWNRSLARGAWATALASALALLALLAWAPTGRISLDKFRVDRKVEERQKWSASGQDGSCKEYGCIAFNKTNKCQCNIGCTDYESCCSDYKEQCSEEDRHHYSDRSEGRGGLKKRHGSCAKYGCIGFQPKHDCQCNPDCATFNSCCDDATEQCNSTGKWAKYEQRMARERKEQEERVEKWRQEQREVLHPKRKCRWIRLGDSVEVRDSAVSTWLRGTVTSLNPVSVKPDGWQAGVQWSSFRQDKHACHPLKEQMESRRHRNRCHTCVVGEPCYALVRYAMEVDSKFNRIRYRGLSRNSSFEDYQELLHSDSPGHCPRPCMSGDGEKHEHQAEKEAKDGVESGPTCLCLFDIDRTLTCKQGKADECPGTKEVHGAKDWAYGGGPLTLSELAVNMPATFCGKCYKGIVSAGSASGSHSKERAALLEALGGPQWTLSDQWSRPFPHVSSLLVLGAYDQHKQDSVKGIVHWLHKEKGIVIDDKEVHFFDDNVNNPPPFVQTRYNAIQVSCTSRGTSRAEQAVGYCGARASEVVQTRGVRSCDGAITTETTTKTPDESSGSSSGSSSKDKYKFTYDDWSKGETFPLRQPRGSPDARSLTPKTGKPVHASTQ